MPTDDMHQLCQTLEREFNQFHGEDLRRTTDPIGAPQEICIFKFRSMIEVDVLKYFIKVRTFIRMKYLNTEIYSKLNSEKLRAMKQLGKCGF